ncbi:hypothetical protein Vadar_030067 [Vaccinium darrowii]|uniref:Uncharacterized protein n=1 Tax=Vaccinium darrowii TaxID=229202 RepID=A0ACB7YSQ3_9ERIC|nr:hypothetical protein Vadar_030067 [Vaccinium darrowii]
MSDEQKGLIEAVRNLFPHADHRFCVRHPYNNFKQDFKGLVLKDILWKAARASTVQNFNRAMGEIKDINVKAYEWLIQRPSVNWSRSQFSSYTKCDILLNNLCESFNSSILRARDQPIVSMLERIRLILMDTLQKKRTAMMRYKGLICPKIVKRIEKMRENEKGWIPRWCSDYEYEVTGPYGQYKVYLDKRHCGCRKWDIFGIPCIHAIAAIGFNNLEPHDYVDDWYSVDTLLKTYDNLMGPINGREMWPSPDNVELLPPDVKKRLGRPKKARRREPEEPTAKDPCRLGRKGIKMTCRNCGKVGHNKRGCKYREEGSGATVDAGLGDAGEGVMTATVDTGSGNGGEGGVSVTSGNGGEGGVTVTQTPATIGATQPPTINVQGNGGELPNSKYSPRISKLPIFGPEKAKDQPTDSQRNPEHLLSLLPPGDLLLHLVSLPQKPRNNLHRPLAHRWVHPCKILSLFFGTCHEPPAWVERGPRSVELPHITADGTRAVLHGLPSLNPPQHCSSSDRELTQSPSGGPKTRLPNWCNLSANLRSQEFSGLVSLGKRHCCNAPVGLGFPWLLQSVFEFHLPPFSENIMKPVSIAEEARTQDLDTKLRTDSVMKSNATHINLIGLQHSIIKHSFLASQFRTI